MSRNLLVHCAPFALVLVSACMGPVEGSVNRYSGGEGSRSVTTEESNWIFAQQLKMEHLVQTRQNEVLVVQFDLVNQGSTPLGFQWSVAWFDRAGLTIDDSTQHWTPERLAGGASKTLKLVAPTAQAMSWQLQVGSRDEVR